ncbi:MAG: cytochrome c biogenesis protein CcsA [Candidatus Marinimicrobia bacterium]|nr:cytochrome c biogenesis protein CcsA [Candidatus Neomarinimicrobiota bacterium]MBT3945470.1 cytochrome c biogenesis protein CcsA [Candidatus Neomarinimicrobiota bacterium]MBT4155337.1 cytochrome c biogenesis protein CcsA [Candidatus Neomarinimicrobiota bacterium]MBT4555179.1 cytochrome c biogenesis protein CcsA [Candidatus Neomarinimicrobiota bacterium]MBT4752573.1 cytochrome c biogenesis protein CcsA [Candidatus Neomarinimicrobiota bacterium]
MPFFNHRNNLIHAGIAVALSAINIFIVITLDPPNAAQGIFGNIFYIHVPVSWTAFLLYFMVMISGIMFLTKKESIWDHRGLAFAEVGTLFMFLILTTGPIWAKPAWGHFWPWEPRLTTSLILFLIFLGYFMLREFGGNTEQVSRYGAVVGILAFLDVPLIFFSVKFWLPEMQSHPQVGSYFDSGNLFPTFLVIFSLITFIIISTLMVRFRVSILKQNNIN